MIQKILLGSVAAAAFLSPAVAAAQTIGGSVQAPARAFPSTFGTITAVAPVPNSGFIGLTYVDPRGGIAGADADGDLAFGYTIGNPVDNVAVTLSVGITSLDDFGESGNVNLSFSRLLGTGERSATFLGAAATNLAAWGDAADNDESYALYVSHLASFGSGAAEVPVLFTLGYGTDVVYADDGSGDIDEGLFAGVGIGVTEALSVSFSGNENQLNVGLGLTLPEVPNLAFTAGVYDATDNVERQQFALGVSFGF